jgi:hypothetical protein
LVLRVPVLRGGTKRCDSRGYCFRHQFHRSSPPIKTDKNELAAPTLLVREVGLVAVERSQGRGIVRAAQFSMNVR